MGLFFAVASCLLLAVYCLRLHIRSGAFRDISEACKRGVALRSAIPEGQDIPTHAWCLWLLDLPLVDPVLAVAPMAAYVSLTLLSEYNPDVFSWPLFAFRLWSSWTVLITVSYQILLRSDSPKFYPIKKLFRVWFTFSIVVGLPCFYLQTMLEGPPYILLLVMSACILLFAIILWLCRPIMACRTTTLTLWLFSLYLVISPAVIIQWGYIYAVDTWSNPLRIGVICACVVGALLLTVLMYYFFGKVHQDRIRRWWEEEHLVRFYQRHRLRVWWGRA